MTSTDRVRQIALRMIGEAEAGVRYSVLHRPTEDELGSVLWQHPPLPTSFQSKWQPTPSKPKKACGCALGTHRKGMLVAIGSLLIVACAGAKEVAVPQKTIFVPIFKGEKMKQPIREVIPGESYDVLSPTESGYVVLLKKASFYPPIGYINRERSGYRLVDEDNTGDVRRIIIRYQMNGNLMPGYIPFKRNVPYDIVTKTEKELHLLYSFGGNVTTGSVSVADCSIVTSQASSDGKSSLGARSNADTSNEKTPSRSNSSSDSDSFQVKTQRGILERCRISRIEPDGITFVHSKGVSKLSFHELPPEYATKYKPKESSFTKCKPKESSLSAIEVASNLDRIMGTSGRRNSFGGGYSEVVGGGRQRFSSYRAAQNYADQMERNNQGSMDAMREQAMMTGGGVYEGSSALLSRYRVISDDENPGYWLVVPY